MGELITPVVAYSLPEDEEEVVAEYEEEFEKEEED